MGPFYAGLAARLLAIENNSQYDGSMTEARESEEADRLLAAVLYLMCCHARTGCPRLAFMIEKHFEAIGHHPEVGDRVRDTCRRLRASWVAIRQHGEGHVRPAPHGALLH
jgi:hypothetical protein